MTGKRIALDTDDLVRRYVHGESQGQLAALFGVSVDTIAKRLAEGGAPRKHLPAGASPAWLSRAVALYLAGDSPAKIAPVVSAGVAAVENHLKRAGVLRSQAAARALLGGERTDTAVRIAEAIAMREQGMTQREIGEHFGVTQSRVSTWLLSRGIRADPGEAMTRRLAGMTSAERKALASAAHDAVRGVKRSHDELARRALTNQKIKSHATDEERTLGALLATAGLSPVLQQALDKYNLDIGLAPVAVELFGGGWHAHGRHAARMPQRVKDIADAGLNLLIVWTHRVHPLDFRTVADDVLAYHELSSSDPTFRRQYRVIWGDGQFIASGSVDDDKLTLIPMGIRGTYATRR